VPCERRHLHPEGDLRYLCLGQPLVDGLLDEGAFFLKVLCFPEVFVKVDADECFVFQGVGVQALPPRPDPVPRVAFEGTVMDLLRECHRGFYDHVCALEHGCDSFGALKNGYALADGHADMAAAHQLGNAYEHGKPFFRPHAEHCPPVCAPARHSLERKSVRPAEHEDLRGKFFVPEPHGVGHVSRSLDDEMPFSLFPPGEKVIVQDHFFSQVGHLLFRHLGELEYIPPGHEPLLEPQGRSFAHLDEVECAAHLVADDRRAGGDPVDDPLVHKFGNKGGHTLVDVRAAPRGDNDFAALFPRLDYFLHCIVEALPGPAVQVRIKAVQKLLIDHLKFISP